MEIEKQNKIQALNLEQQGSASNSFPKLVIPIIDKQKPKQIRWNIIENQIYANFLLENSKLFDTENSRRSNQVFKKLSSTIKTKSANQCKSHHQKMMKHYKNFDRIIQEFKLKYEHECSKISTVSLGGDRSQKIDHNSVTKTEFLQHQSMLLIQLKYTSIRRVSKINEKQLQQSQLRLESPPSTISNISSKKITQFHEQKLLYDVLNLNK